MPWDLKPGWDDLKGFFHIRKVGSGDEQKHIQPKGVDGFVEKATQGRVQSLVRVKESRAGKRNSEQETSEGLPCSPGALKKKGSKRARTSGKAGKILGPAEDFGKLNSCRQAEKSNSITIIP